MKERNALLLLLIPAAAAAFTVPGRDSASACSGVRSLDRPAAVLRDGRGGTGGGLYYWRCLPPLITSALSYSTDPIPPPLPDTADPFVLLGIEKPASVKDVDLGVIKRAYKRMAQVYHPDASVSEERTDEEKQRFNDDLARINAAYEALKSADGDLMPGVTAEAHEAAKKKAREYGARQWWEEGSGTSDSSWCDDGGGSWSSHNSGGGSGQRVRYRASSSPHHVVVDGVPSPLPAGGVRVRYRQAPSPSPSTSPAPSFVDIPYESDASPSDDCKESGDAFSSDPVPSPSAGFSSHETVMAWPRDPADRVEASGTAEDIGAAAATAEARCKVLEEELAKFRSEASDMVSSHERERNAMESKISEANKRCKTLEQSLTAATNIVSLRDKEKRALEDDVAKAKVRCRSLEEALEQSKSGAEVMLSKREKENSELEKKVTEATVLCDSLKDSLKRSRSEAADVVSLRENEKEELARKVAELQQDLEQARRSALDDRKKATSSKRSRTKKLRNDASDGSVPSGSLEVKKGKHKGRICTVVRYTKKMAWVVFEGEEEQFRIAKTSLGKARKPTKPKPVTTAPPSPASKAEGTKTNIARTLQTRIGTVSYV